MRRLNNNLEQLIAIKNRETTGIEAMSNKPAASPGNDNNNISYVPHHSLLKELKVLADMVFYFVKERVQESYARLENKNSYKSTYNRNLNAVTILLNRMPPSVTKDPPQLTQGPDVMKTWSTQFKVGLKNSILAVENDLRKKNEIGKEKKLDVTLLMRNKKMYT